MLSRKHNVSLESELAGISSCALEAKGAFGREGRGRKRRPRKEADSGLGMRGRERIVGELDGMEEEEQGPDADDGRSHNMYGG